MGRRGPRSLSRESAIRHRPVRGPAVCCSLRHTQQATDELGAVQPPVPSTKSAGNLLRLKPSECYKWASRLSLTDGEVAQRLESIVQGCVGLRRDLLSAESQANFVNVSP